jgi:formate dehydrogenase iron-sulfur subunit
VLDHADDPEAYGLPKNPRIPWAVSLWKGPVKWFGNTLLIGGALGAFFHYVRYGPQSHGDESHE